MAEYIKGGLPYDALAVTRENAVPKDYGDNLNTLTSNGDPSTQLTDALYGVNASSKYKQFHINRDVDNLVLFTRPQLNLTTDNISGDAILSQLLVEDNTGLSVKSYIRHLLDPRLDKQDVVDGKIVNGLPTPLLNPGMPFIPILSNALKTITGWPDPVLPTYVAPEGNKKEQWSMVDGAINIFNVFDIDTKFVNLSEEPITLLMQVWTRYASLVYEGKLSPYSDYVVNRTIDYQTRIYNIVRGNNPFKIKKVASTGVSMVKNIPMGLFFDRDKDVNDVTQSKEIDFRFESSGADYNNIRRLMDFNFTVAAFNPQAAEIIYNSYPFEVDAAKNGGLVKLSFELLNILDNKAIPIIDIKNSTLEWWIEQEHVKLTL